MSWRDCIDTTQPYWQDSLRFLEKIDSGFFPDCDQLNAILPGGLISGAGEAIKFVPSTELGDDGYEHRIYTTGKISTRSDDWHDLFNAMIWMQFPAMKIAMNTLHYNALSQQSGGSRGPIRDALTLFDECGVIVFSDRLDILNLLVERDWKKAFDAVEFSDHVKLAISGHAMLEKYLSPYKSITAKAIYVYVNTRFINSPRQDQLAALDRALAARLLSGELLASPACLAPLPLAGIPGWWPRCPQDDSFYDDTKVFRPAPARLIPTPIISL